MMASTKLKCFACDFGTKINFKMPSFCEVTCHVFECSGCESRLLARIKRTGKGREIQVSIKVMQASATFDELMKERREQAIEDAKNSVNQAVQK